MASVGTCKRSVEHTENTASAMCDSINTTATALSDIPNTL